MKQVVNSSTIKLADSTALANHRYRDNYNKHVVLSWKHIWMQIYTHIIEFVISINLFLIKRLLSLFYFSLGDRTFLIKYLTFRLERVKKAHFRSKQTHRLERCEEQGRQVHRGWGKEEEGCWLARGEVYSGIGSCQRAHRHARMCWYGTRATPCTRSCRARRKQWRKIMHCGGAHCEPESCDIEFGQLRAFVSPPPYPDSIPSPSTCPSSFAPHMQRCSGSGARRGELSISDPTGRSLSFSSIAEGKYARKSDLSNIIHAREGGRAMNPWKSLFPAADFSFFLYINRIFYV